MRRAGFTLLELLVSIFLLSFILLFLFKSIENLNISNRVFESNTKKTEIRDKVMKVLYDDIFYAKKIFISGKDIQRVDMLTTNSLHDIESAYVTWMVSSKKDNTLLRLEASKSLRNNFSYEDRYTIHINQVAKKCKKFQVHKSKKGDKFLIHIKFEDQKPIIFEFFKPN